MTDTTRWHQINIGFTDYDAAPAVAATRLAPQLESARHAGRLHRWWFIRKRPWRLRYVPGDGETCPLADALNALAADGLITGWARGLYEPETVAFGGADAMEIAHTLFHADSRFLLARAAAAGVSRLGARETTVVLCSTLLRAARQDLYEQADVWSKVADLRPPPLPLTPERAATLAPAVGTLMAADPHALCDGGPLDGYAPWVAAFEHAGRALADLADCGRLERGLRAVLAHHLIFHANRAGLPIGDQATLARLIADTVFGSGAHRRPAHLDPPHPLRSPR